MEDSDLAADMERAMRVYIEACNSADADAISGCFHIEAVHYLAAIPKWSGVPIIGQNFAKRVAETGQWWTIDQILTDTRRCAAVLEYTQFDTSSRKILRGVDWFVFEPSTLQIREIRPYVAARPDPDNPRQELQGLDYKSRGYPVKFPE
jgi:methyltransferase